MLTLGVDDLERAVAFYRNGLKLPTEGIIGTEFEHDAVAFFKLNGGSLIRALWPRTSMAAESGVPLGPRSATELMIAHNVDSKATVDAVLAEAARAGVTITVRTRT